MSKYPAIPDASNSPQAMLATIQSLTEAVRLLTGQKGDNPVATKNDLAVVATKATTTVAGQTKPLQDDIEETKLAFNKAISNLYKAIADWLAGLSSADDDIKVQINSLDSKVGDTEAAIFEANVTRAREDFALAGKITSLTTTVGDNTAAFNDFKLAQSDKDTAIAGQLKVISTSVGDNKTAISDEVIARSDADTAIGLRIDQLTAKTGDDITAAIQAERAVRTNAEEAISRDVLTLSSSVNGPNGVTSQLTTLAQTVSGPNGLTTTFGVTGRIDQASGGFIFEGVKKNDGSAAFFNTIFNSNVTINGNLLVTGTVNTGALAPNAITAGTSARNVQSCTSYITVPVGAYLLVICSQNDYVRLSYTPYVNMAFRMYLNGLLAGESLCAPMYIFDKNNNSVSTDYPQQIRVFTWQNQYGTDLVNIPVNFQLQGLGGGYPGAILAGTLDVSLAALVFKR